MPIIPQDIEQAYRMAQLIHQSGTAPKGMDTPEKIVTAIIHGSEIGLPPMQALQSIAVINGRPTIWGDGALSLVRASGLLEDFEEVVKGTGDTMFAVCTAMRRGQATAIQHSFSMGDAKLASLLDKDPWKKYPRRMLQMRARSWVLRDGFADVLRGLSVAEEARDITPSSPPPPRPYGNHSAEIVDVVPDENLDPIEEMIGRVPEDQGEGEKTDGS